MTEEVVFKDLLVYTKILGDLNRSKTYHERSQLTVCKEAVEIILEMYPKSNMENMR